MKPSAKSDTAKLLSLATQTAKDAGAVLQKRSDSKLAIRSAEGKDIKIAADQEVERLIRGRLSEGSHFGVLGEEEGVTGELVDDLPYWIVDPLDGTLNYTRANPACCVSIGLWHNREPILGAIYHFPMDDMYTGVVAKGAFCNAVAVHPTLLDDKSQAVYATGIPVSMNLDEEGMGALAARIRSYKKIRMIGSAALSLAYVASGRFDVYEEKNIKFWDVAAGLALVKASGGYISFVETDTQRKTMHVKAAATRELLYQ
ncbi:MAG: inositol monophosphatase family protein [Thermodesulfobacteriota bacterium]|nr:inositol monophosphatase family protein [Thermodesulfobacteriota bacterium]